MSTSTDQTTECTPPAPEAAQPIITTILADVNAITFIFSSLVSSYRLLVGAAEEIHRIPGVCPDVFERAVRRFDNAGSLIDILLDLLCCKINYSSEFLGISCLPVDLFRLLANRSVPCDQSHRTAEQIIALEALGEALTACRKYKCFPDTPVVCPIPPASALTTESPPPITGATASALSTSSTTRLGKSFHFKPKHTSLRRISKDKPTTIPESNSDPLAAMADSNPAAGVNTDPQHKLPNQEIKDTKIETHDEIQSSVRRRHI